MIVQTPPDIRLYQAHGRRHDPFAKFDYMHVLPTKSALEIFMRLCDSFRKDGIKLPSKFLASEMRAYIALSDNRYTTTTYPWEEAVTDCWLTTSETWLEDLPKQWNLQK